MKKEMPLDIAGSSTFGRDPKIMASRTFNMLLADGWSVDYAGWKKVLGLSPTAKGRGLFASIPANRLISVYDNKVYLITINVDPKDGDKTFLFTEVGTINSFSGDVFMDENNVNQIAICDLHKIYIFNHQTGDFRTADLPEGFIPGYVAYQDGYFIAPDTSLARWALSAVGDGLNWFWGNSGEPVEGGFQTKGDNPVACIPFPGRGNLLLIMGSIVTELWTGVSSPSFPYQRSSSMNIDYGCVNPATIAYLDNIVIWLGANNQSNPVIMYSTGADVKQISTDGINYKLSQLKNPSRSAGFFVKISGHLIYQLTFYDPEDNWTILYDFTTEKFFDATDENMNFHIARQVQLFNNEYYFVSFNDGNLYLFSPELTTFDYGLYQDGTPKVFNIPRVRIPKNTRMPGSGRFLVNKLSFTLEQGNDTTNDSNDPNYLPRVDLSFSNDGGYSFSGASSYPLNTVGNRINKIDWWGLGSCNDFVPQFRFYSRGPWRATDGKMDIYQ